jgi:hypothetical protein
MKKSEALKLLDRSHALKPCKNCRAWGHRVDHRCPECGTSPKARIAFQAKAGGK